MSKKEFIIAIIVGILISVAVLAIPKKNLPTEEQWESHMEYIESPEFQERL